MGRALWMLSISANAWPVEAWTPKLRAIVTRLADKVLDGIGTPGDDRIIDGNITLTWRRQCSQAERAKVREPYLQPGIK